MKFGNLLRLALAEAERKAKLATLKLHCPKCGTPQVELRSWNAVPALWKCRECKHSFTKDIETEE